MKLLYLIGILMLVSVVSAQTITVTAQNQYDGLTYQEVAEKVSASEPNDAKFVARVVRLVRTRLTYTPSTSFDVKSPQRAWDERVGDCSEQALLIVEMISPRVKAQVVHGYLYGVSHDSVEWIDGKYRKVIDDRFFKSGDGLYPNERVV